VDVIYHNPPKGFLNNSYRIKISTSIKFICILKFRDNIDNDMIKKIIELWYLRNNLAAHDTGNINKNLRMVRKDDILFLIDVLFGIFHQPN